MAIKKGGNKPADLKNDLSELTSQALNAYPAPTPKEEGSDLSPDAEELSTLDGIKNRLADIASRARRMSAGAGSIRDQSAALGIEARCIKLFLDITVSKEALDKAEELEASASKLDQQLGGQTGGVTRRNEAPEFIVSEDPETN